MLPKKLWLLAALALGACGGQTDGTVETDPAIEPPDSQAAVEPELVADDPAQAPTTGRFQMGAHYTRLSPTQPTSSNPDQIEVAEVFWYGCPHCFAFDPLLEQWREQQPDYVNFVRIPAVWNPLLQLHARAFHTAEALGKGAEMHTELFREIHERGNMLDSEAKLQEFFSRFGVDAAAFKTTFDSFAVQAKLQRADELNRRYRIQSVPTIVVNGKYVTDGPQVDSYEVLLELVDELVAAEREAR
ncbi:MAG: thiol:disulfide interchange protein DsbA/DsbL [Lysobacterales bacterium]|nr:MAG: thiol:disulfide interchange protein DsbA/DsbL [Xanthomonadales bacterium]